MPFVCYDLFSHTQLGPLLTTCCDRGKNKYSMHRWMTFRWNCFQETDFKEWKLVVQEIVKFRKAYPAFMNIRPLRYSVVLDLHPDCLPQVVEAKRKLRLRDALLCSYHPNEVSLCMPTFCSNWKRLGLLCSLQVNLMFASILINCINIHSSFLSTR